MNINDIMSVTSQMLRLYVFFWGPRCLASSSGRPVLSTTPCRQMSPDVARCCQMLPDVARCCQMSSHIKSEKSVSVGQLYFNLARIDSHLRHFDVRTYFPHRNTRPVEFVKGRFSWIDFAILSDLSECMYKDACRPGFTYCSLSSLAWEGKIE